MSAKEIKNEFEKLSFFPRLGRRGPNFAVMVEHLAENGGYVVETGTAWDRDNFEGQGQSTIIWDWLCGRLPGLKAISIDIRQEGIDVAAAQAKHVEFKCGDSIKTLANLDPKIVEKISVLYLDSFDWTKELNLDSALHHLAELCGVWAKLPSGCLIAVDDRHGNGAGKHWIVEAYMDALGIKPVFKNCQMGWIKP